MNVKKVMPEDIDPDLVDTICEAIGYNTGPKRYVQLTLAYLANNPIDLTPEAQGSITKEWDTTSHGWTNYVKFIADRTQRIAFLKKEPELPREVQQLFYADAFDGSIMKGANERITAAYKLGKECQK